MRLLPTITVAILALFTIAATASAAKMNSEGSMGNKTMMHKKMSSKNHHMMMKGNMSRSNMTHNGGM